MTSYEQANDELRVIGIAGFPPARVPRSPSTVLKPTVWARIVPQTQTPPQLREARSGGPCHTCDQNPAVSFAVDKNGPIDAHT